MEHQTSKHFEIRALRFTFQVASSPRFSSDHSPAVHVPFIPSAAVCPVGPPGL
jgi:hypothetical protein